MRCTKCGKPIEFIRMKNDKLMPVDAEMAYLREAENGMIKAVMPNGRTFDAFFAQPGQPGTVKAYVTHWPNCVKGMTRSAKLTQSEYRKRQEETKRCRILQTRHPHGEPSNTKQDDKNGKPEQLVLF